MARRPPNSPRLKAPGRNGNNHFSIPDAGSVTVSQGYDAAETKTRRRSPPVLLVSEDRLLNPQRRRQLVSNTRDLARNFAPFAWAVRKHLDYVSTFSLQAKTGVPEADAAIEAFVRTWSRAENCDVAARHCLAALVRLCESGRTLDGDVLVVKLDDGRLQIVEGDRVTNPTNSADPKAFEDCEHGVKVGPGGRAEAFIVCKRTKGGKGFEYEATIPAEFAFHHGYFTRIDQVRGVSPLASAINPSRDCYEAGEYALAKMKLAQLFALAIYRELGGDPVGPVSPLGGTAGEGEGEADAEAAKYEVDFGKGPLLLDLDPGDRAESRGRPWQQPLAVVVTRRLAHPAGFVVAWTVPRRESGCNHL